MLIRPAPFKRSGASTPVSPKENCETDSLWEHLNKKDRGALPTMRRAKNARALDQRECRRYWSFLFPATEGCSALNSAVFGPTFFQLASS
jgi:hypothetical protein